MPTDSFEKTSWDWQLSQLRQQVGEWTEYEFSRFRSAIPEWPKEWSISPWLAKLLNVLFWLVVAGLLVWVIWRLWQEFRPYIYSWLRNRGNNFATNRTVEADELSVSLLLERSQQLYRQGNYREACRCLYLALLQHLHDRSIIRHQPSRTDGEYLQLLRSIVTPIQPYETLITTHEQLCFGNAEILPENYEHCQQAYREIAGLDG
ncbi:DUF4129 domain-containing protein [Tolypothrix sp. FACHB-123]|uniref:DUF4129 domain-containing protein n=1 Tax=Tolypothrix sp. FACHB-123 TaxID=2692868 RepID=UPI00168233C4|nr:DUF4129 domain-containing protein [Tolypothrix sp. FACHB-123]MBD2359067.1 DUF4129 domain-containing protein [Tolypothrix sp. FACHB-123]